MKRCGLLFSLVVVGEGAATRTTCSNLKDVYKQETCCGKATKEVGFQIVPDPQKGVKLAANPCKDKKPTSDADFNNKPCFVDTTVQALEQAGADITKGKKGGMTVPRKPITAPYWKKGLCPVNVHWHLGAEHRSEGEFDETGTGPLKAGTPSNYTDPTRRLGSDSNVRYGYACKHYDASDAKFTTPYKWHHCVGMHVGETYEVHWPHSKIGACNTPHQFQSPFYDGVFCGWSAAVKTAVLKNDAQPLVDAVGVQGQVFTIVNDENYYYPDLMRGAIVDGEFWKDVAAYTGSTTGTSRDNKMCSSYTPITWQVDRKCHLISASSFDKMCADMKQQADDMSMDLHAHGARELVNKPLVADNMEDYKP